MLLLLLAPFVPLVLASLAKGYLFPQLFPESWSTRAWRIVLDPGGATWAALVDTVAIGVTVMVLSLVVASPPGASSRHGGSGGSGPSSSSCSHRCWCPP
jgi:putative spermidine/putrescine transport system permease protein